MAKRDSGKPKSPKAAPKAPSPRDKTSATTPAARPGPADSAPRKVAQAAAAKEKPAAARSAPRPVSPEAAPPPAAKAPAGKAPTAEAPAGKAPAAKAGKAPAVPAPAKASTSRAAPVRTAPARSTASKPTTGKKAAAAIAPPPPPATAAPVAAASVAERSAPAAPRRPLSLVAGGKAAEVRETPAAPPPAAPPSPAAEAAGDDPFRFQALDVERLSSNIARMVELGGKALAAYLKPRETGTHPSDSPDSVADVAKTLGHVAEFWLKDPQRAMVAQSEVATRYMDLWAQSLKAMAGEPTEPVVRPDPRDARFKDPQWEKNPFFDFLKQFYLVTTGLAEKFVTEAELDEHLKHKASFYAKQIANALSPSNFVVTNPELLRETISSNAENLVRGMKMFAEDVERGGGDLRIRQSDDSQFAVGRNLAMTPGKVVFENDLIQLIQYEPTTKTVGKVPLVIVPPWINKFYILDLTQEKSFIKWAVDQGLTVFVVSWVNPDQRHASKSFDDYMLEGPLAAFRVAGEITGEEKVHAIGYCVGGTLLAVTLAYMAAKGMETVQTATFFTTQVDFTHAGDLKVFVDEEQIQSLEKRMAQTGYLEGKQMANAFNMLRSNDLIWSYFVNNYMKGKQPMPFDLLYWNADSPRMPAANHSFYLRHCYLQNDLSRTAAWRWLARRWT
jgi:polyhydroxyalkanoate synthase